MIFGVRCDKLYLFCFIWNDAMGEHFFRSVLYESYFLRSQFGNFIIRCIAEEDTKLSPGAMNGMTAYEVDIRKNGRKIIWSSIVKKRQQNEVWEVDIERVVSKPSTKNNCQDKMISTLDEMNYFFSSFRDIA